MKINLYKIKRKIINQKQVFTKVMKKLSNQIILNSILMLARVLKILCQVNQDHPINLSNFKISEDHYLHQIKTAELLLEKWDIPKQKRNFIIIKKHQTDTKNFMESTLKNSF